MMAALLAAFLRMTSRRRSTTPVPLSCNWYSNAPPPRPSTSPSQTKVETIASSETVVRVVSTLLSSRLRFETDYKGLLFLISHVLFISLNSNSSAKP